MKLKQLLQSIREDAPKPTGYSLRSFTDNAGNKTTGKLTPVYAKGNKKSLELAYAKVKKAAEEQVGGKAGDKKPRSTEEAKRFLAQGKGPARRS